MLIFREPAAKIKHEEHYEFGPFQLISIERQLLRDGTPVPITDKAFETLLALVGRSGHLVEKSELIAAVWKDSCVEEGNLAVTICMIRKALGDSRREPKYIQTITKRGYRFVAATRLLRVPTILRRA
jgi:DNA-binding winged helix-turn-helix (wHTH) protein